MKKSRKTIISVLVAGMFAITLAACGGTPANSATSEPAASTSQPATTTGSEPATNNPAPAAAAAVTGKTLQLAGYSILVPDGWVSNEYFEGQQAKLFKTDSMENATDAPQIDVEYKANGEYVLATVTLESHENIAPLTIGKYTWEGVQGTYKYQPAKLTMLHTKVGDGYIAVTVWTTKNGGTISLEDPDVKAILESITVQ